MELENKSQSAALIVSDPAKLSQLIRFAEFMTAGTVTVPAHLRKPADYLAMTLQALQWGMNPASVAQKTHLVNGVLGYEAQLVNSIITAMAPTQDRLHFDWFGPWEKVIGRFEIKRGDKGEYRVPGWKMADEEGCGVKVWATIKGEDSPRELTLLLAQARVRNSTLWADDPKQQIAYLATKKWARLYCPEVIMGVYTPDELGDPIEKDITPRKTARPWIGAEVAAEVAEEGSQTTAETLLENESLFNELEAAAYQGIDTYRAAWKACNSEQRAHVGIKGHERLKDIAKQATATKEDKHPEAPAIDSSWVSEFSGENASESETP